MRISRRVNAVRERMRVRCVFRDSVLIRPWIPEDEDEEDDEGDEEGWYEVEEVEVVEGSETFMHAQLDMDVPMLTGTR